MDPGIIATQDLILVSKAGPIKGLTMMEMLKIARVSSVEGLERTFRPPKNLAVYHQRPRARKVSLVNESSSTSKATLDTELASSSFGSLNISLRLEIGAATVDQHPRGRSDTAPE